MYKIMIVEDNASTREGLCRNIPWAENNIEVIADLPNGKEAVEHLKKDLPDVVITDIVMPIMDGLALTHVIKQEYPDIKVIILSAYDEFEYAQEAIKTGVFDYVMKPFDYQCLLDTVKKALNEKKQEDVFREQVKKSIPVLRDKFLLQLVEEDPDDLVFMDDMKYLGLQFNQKHYLCVVFAIDNIKQVKSKMKMERFNIQLLRIADTIGNSFKGTAAWVFRTGNNCFASIFGFSGEDASAIDNLLYEKLEFIQKEVEKKCEMTLSIGIGNVVSPISNVAGSYRKAQDVLEYRFIMGSNRIFNSKDTVFTGNAECMHFPLSIEEKLIRKVCLGNKAEALECIRELEEYFRTSTANKGYMQTVVFGLVSKMYQKLYETGIKTDQIFLSREKIFRKMQDFDESMQMFNWMEGMVATICDEVESCMFQHHKQIIKEVEDFIATAYMKEDLNLNAIAGQVCVSPTYLSAIFKKEAKINISDYILNVRMEKAQELLRFSDLKISDISLKVGYSNQFYFSTCFKKYTGRTPNDFRSTKK